MINSIIVHPNDDGSVSFGYPVPDCGIPFNEIARMSVPRGKPYLLVPDEFVPKDHTFFNAFEADFSNPDGYGIGPNAWHIEQYEKELATLNPETDAGRIAELNGKIEIQRQEALTLGITL